MTKTTDDRTPRASPQALVMAQIGDEDQPMPSDEDVKRIAREHHLPGTEANALVRFARAVSKMAGEWKR
jgi:3,4-dihydroxy-2-butanone 4-phosphate synthase